MWWFSSLSVALFLSSAVVAAAHPPVDEAHTFVQEVMDRFDTVMDHKLTTEDRKAVTEFFTTSLHSQSTSTLGWVKNGAAAGFSAPAKAVLAFTDASSPSASVKTKISPLVWALSAAATLIAFIPTTAAGAVAGLVTGLSDKHKTETLLDSDRAIIFLTLNKLYEALLAECELLQQAKPGLSHSGIEDLVLESLQERLEEKLKDSFLYAFRDPVNMDEILPFSRDPLYTMASIFVQSDLTWDGIKRISAKDYAALFAHIPQKTQDPILHRQLCLAAAYYFLKEFQHNGHTFGPSTLRWALSSEHDVSSK